MAGVTPHPTRLPNREAQSHVDRKVLRPAFAWQDSTAEEHAIAFTVAKMMDEDMLAETQKALQDALAQGTDFATFKARLKPYLMARGWWGKQLMGDPQDGEIKLVQLGSTRRLRTIYHTNLHSAYAAGQWARIERNKKAFPYLKYIPSDAAFPREEHRRFYGMILPVDDPFWQTHMPPNGWGCRCNVRALTRAQAEKEGISPSPQLEDVEHINTRTGEVEHYPEGVDPSFAHNPGDRLGALKKIYAEKLHGRMGADDVRAHMASFERRLDDYMLELIEQPDFSGREYAVTGSHFAERLRQLAQAVQKAGGDRRNSLQLRQELARGDKWIVATVSPSVQAALATETALVQLSDDTLIKMLAHHPQESTPELFRDARYLLRNAEKIRVENGQYAIYYSTGHGHYKAVVKATRDKKELYLTTLFRMKEKEFRRELGKT